MKSAKVLISISEKNVRVNDILEDLERRSINKSGFICQAIIEKYDKMVMEGGDTINLSPPQSSVPQISKELLKEVLSELLVSENLSISTIINNEKNKEENHTMPVIENIVEQPKEEQIIQNYEQQEEDIDDDENSKLLLGMLSRMDDD